ncbi:MAG: hypothetical protein AB7O91_11445 [Sphingomonas sp.]
MRPRSLILLAATSLLGGCYSFYGPAPVLDSRGVVADDAHRPRGGIPYERFRLAAMRASGCEPIEGPTDQALRCPPVPGPDQQAVLQHYMRTGFALILAECVHYLDHMSRNQARANIMRDSITPLTTLINGIVALRGDTSGGIPELALATATARSTLDIFDQRFLFGANNIDAVRQMVLRTLGAHGQAALAMPNLNFEIASGQILRNQEICTPSRILTLTRESIQNAVPAPDNAAATAGKPGGITAGQNISTTSVSVPPR